LVLLELVLRSVLLGWWSVLLVVQWELVQRELVQQELAWREGRRVQLLQLWRQPSSAGPSLSKTTL
jgi:hypothetical protein